MWAWDQGTELLQDKGEMTKGGSKPVQNFPTLRWGIKA
jgi:hypothetical protein